MIKKITLFLFLLFTFNFNIIYADDYKNIDFNNCKMNMAYCNVSNPNIEELTKENIDAVLGTFYTNMSNKYTSLYDLKYIYSVLTDKLKVVAWKWNVYDYKTKLNSYIYSNVESEYYKVWYAISINNTNLQNDKSLDEFKSMINNSNNELKPQANNINDSFNSAKRILEKYIYNWKIMERKTIYCWCDYSETKLVDPKNCWFMNNWKHIERSKSIEWEHVVPAENFWQSFIEWREWHKDCVDSKWKSFKWRECAWKVNEKYRYMEADMYNLYPAIGALNALRSNYQVAEVLWEKREFWKCDFEIADQKMEPPTNMKWDIARVYRYMDTTYPWHWIVSDKNKKLFEVWEKIDPISNEECNRYKSIKNIQKNINIVLEEKCMNF